MRKFFRISPQQSIHRASSDSENYEMVWEGERIIRVDFICVTTKSA